MVANPHVVGIDEVREHQAFRLPGWLIAIIEDVARGVEEGEAGLKSCGAADVDASAGVSRSDAKAMHHGVTEIEDEDECFDRIGDYLANGFSFGEIAKLVSLSGDGVHLLALERWCSLARLECDADEELPTPLASRRWRGSKRHEQRQRCRRTMRLLRVTPGGGTHASVLHIVYGWPDPFLRTLTPEARSALGEFGPLARYTDAVEAKRRELVAAEATGLGAKDSIVDLALHRSRLAWADRVISSGDALRAAADRLVTHDKNARDAFITQVRIEANRMLTAASTAFLDAWQRS